MENRTYCMHCLRENPGFATVTREASIALDDGVEYRFTEKTAVCSECGNPCLNENYRRDNAKAFNDAVRAAHSCISKRQIDELFDCYGETLPSISGYLEIAPDLVRALRDGICPSRRHSELLKALWLGHALEAGEQVPLIAEVRSGGQTGVDRAAFDAAKAAGLPICGWCQKGGWAEDLEEPPGVLSLYPEMVETPEESPELRTVWNVRDADAVLIYRRKSEGKASAGTELAETYGIEHGKPMLIADEGISPEEALSWLPKIGRGLTLSIGGPRESEAPGIYDEARRFFSLLFDAAKTR